MHSRILIGSALTVLGILAAPTTGAEVSGRLLDPDGQPCRGTVRLLEDPDNTGSIPTVQSVGPDGFFAFEGIDDGPRWIRFESPGLEPLLLKETPATPLDIRMERGASLVGRVLDAASGEGLPGATVWVCDLGAGRFGFDACAAHEAGTEGRFAVSGVPATNVRLGASSPEHAFAAIDLKTTNATNRFHLIELKSGAALNGRVVDGAGNPVPGARIGRDQFAFAFTDATEVVLDPPLITDSNGEFRHPGLETRSRWIYRALVEGWYGVPSGWVTPVKDSSERLELRIERPATLQFGLAREDGQRVEPRIRLVHRTMGTASGPHAEASPDGRYRLNDLPTQTLNLRLTIEGHQPLDLGDVPLGAGRIVDLGDLTVHSGVELSGRVLDDEGQGIATGWIELAYSEPVKFTARQTTDDGTFRLNGVPTGVEVRLNFGAEGYDTFQDSVTFDQDTYREVTLPPVASIRGRVLQPEGQPVTRFEVLAVNHDSEAPVPEGDEINDVEGRFFLWPIARPGPHTLEIIAEGFQTKRYEDVLVEPRRGVDIGEVRLDRGHAVEGSATGPDGSPAAGGRVWLASRAAMMRGTPPLNERSFSGRADQDGRYAISGLSAGFFIVKAQHPEYAPWTRELEILADVPTRTLNIDFVEGGVIHGHARGRTGVPEAGVQVAVQCPDLPGDRSASTDAQGYYRVARLPDGQCRVRAFVADGTSFANPKLAAVVATRESRVDFDLSNSIQITGVVRVGGRIANRGFVTFHSGGNASGGGSASAAVEGSSGRYSTYLNEPGEYRVQVESGGARKVVKIQVGNERTIERDFDIPVNWIRGRVVDIDGNPMAEVGITGSNANLDLRSVPGLQTTSNNEGRFQLSFLEPGSYTVSAGKRGFRPTQSSAIAVREDTRVDNVELVLEASLAQMRGRLIDPRGMAMSEGYVVAAAAGGQGPELTSQTSVRPDGTFEIDVPADGPLDVTALASGWAAARVTGFLPSGDREITLQLGFGGRIAITVVDRNGAPAEGTVVQFHAEPAWLGSQTLWLFRAPVVCGPDGVALVETIPAGTYRVSVAGGGSGLVTVREGGTSELRLQSD